MADEQLPNQAMKTDWGTLAALVTPAAYSRRYHPPPHVENPDGSTNRVVHAKDGGK